MRSALLIAIAFYPRWRSASKHDLYGPAIVTAVFNRLRQTLWFFGVVFFVLKPASNGAVAAQNGALVASNGAVGWDPISVAKMTHLGTICLLVFMAGFIWEFRRARRLAGMSFADQNHHK